MADEGNGRATVATVDAKLDGLTKLVETQFGYLQRQLDSVTGLPLEMARLSARMETLEERVGDMEKDQEARAAWRRGGDLPMLVISFLSLLVGLVLLVHYVVP